MLYGLMQSDGNHPQEAELYKLLITATDKDGKRFNKKTSATVKVGDTVYRERYVSAILSVHATHPMDSLHALILVILTRKPE